MMSAVQTKLNGVFRSSLSLRSTQRCGRSNGGLLFVLLGLLVQAGERRLERDLLAVLLVALDRAERQPQREGGVGIGARSLRRRTWPWRSRRRPARFGSSTCVLHDLAHRPRLGIDQPGQRDHRVVRRVDRLLAALVELLAHRRRRRACVPPTSSAARSRGDLPASTFCTSGSSSPSCSAQQGQRRRPA